ncbi:50S ribosomal protein L23 [Leptolyngbya sp. 7M]|uniref:50S ribosomal protein L23 n=1 Tax=Leptolyngbya sp. 7M TaxID=2812896 RepID=UPI001B8B9513|nr:50S ribosomal protein L23 [Leptolyngbya sp. 7M]QYO67387.1 50S ribosomal protein L23 [Leptolyngbya sp. 7M]
MSNFTVWDILKTPVVTEKSMILREESTDDDSGRKSGQVLTFRVERSAGKLDIKKAVEEIFNVKVASVRTVNYEGKMKRRGRQEGRRPNWKKAYVTLKKGEPVIDYSEAI